MMRTKSREQSFDFGDPVVVAVLEAQTRRPHAALTVVQKANNAREVGVLMDDRPGGDRGPSASGHKGERTDRPLPRFPLPAISVFSGLCTPPRPALRRFYTRDRRGVSRFAPSARVRPLHCALRVSPPAGRPSCTRRHAIVTRSEPTRHIEPSHRVLLRVGELRAQSTYLELQSHAYTSSSNNGAAGHDPTHHQLPTTHPHLSTTDLTFATRISGPGERTSESVLRAVCALKKSPPQTHFTLKSGVEHADTGVDEGGRS